MDNTRGWLLGPYHFGRLCFVLSRDDLYVGVFWDRTDGVLYVAPLPAFVFGIRFWPKKAPSAEKGDR